MIDVARARIQELLELGGPVVAILMAMSVLALAVALWKLAVFEIEGIGRGAGRGFVGRAISEARIGAGAPEDVRHRLHARLEAGFGAVASGLRLLDTTAQVAPLLGLFGTVLGMIDAFRTLQEAGSSADPSILAGGIWVALMTTAAGLVVAIPASLAVSWFDGRLETHRRDANEAVEAALSPGVFAGQPGALMVSNAA